MKWFLWRKKRLIFMGKMTQSRSYRVLSKILSTQSRSLPRKRWHVCIETTGHSLPEKRWQVCIVWKTTFGMACWIFISPLNITGLDQATVPKQVHQLFRCKLKKAYKSTNQCILPMIHTSIIEWLCVYINCRKLATNESDIRPSRTTNTKLIRLPPNN